MKPSPSLKSRAISGIFWSGLDQWSFHLLNLAVFLVLSRLLTPEEFGVWGAATICLILSETLLGFGLGQVVIQRSTLTDRLLSTIFFFHLLLTALLIGLIWLLAPIVAGMRGMDDFESVMRLSSFILLFVGFCAVPESLFHRELNFRIITIRRLAGLILGGSAGIWAATQGLGVYSFVIFHLINHLIKTVVAFASSQWKPRLQFSFGDLKEVISDGGRFLSAGLLANGIAQMPGIVTAILLGPYALGVLTFSLRIINILRELVSSATNLVALPLLSKAQKDPGLFSRIMKKLFRLNGLISFPAFLGAGITADILIPFIFGDQWKSAIPCFLILALAQPFLTLTALAQTSLKALGLVGKLVRFFLAKALIYAVILMACSFGGLQGVCAGVLGLALVYFWGTFFIFGRLLHFSLIEVIACIRKAFLSSWIMAILLIFLRWNVFPEPGWAGTLVLIVLGILLYVALQLGMDHKAIREDLRFILANRSAPPGRTFLLLAGIGFFVWPLGYIV